MGTIVFDLDGTLVDTAPDLVEALTATLRRESMPAVPYDKACTLIGHGARRMLERGQKEAVSSGLSPPLTRALSISTAPGSWL